MLISLIRIAGVFLLSFLRNFELTQAVLLDQNALGRIMDLFTKETLLFENHPYDRKVFFMRQALSYFSLFRFFLSGFVNS